MRDSERFLDFFWAKKRFDIIGQGLKDYPHSPLTVLFREGYQELIKTAAPARRGGARTSPPIWR